MKKPKKRVSKLNDSRIMFKKTDVFKVMRNSVVCIGEVKEVKEKFYFSPEVGVSLDKDEIKMIYNLMDVMG